MVGTAVTQQENETTYTCAICYRTIPQSSPDLLKVKVSRPSTAPFQELFVHRTCLKNVIHSKIPLGEVFDEDVL
jgi:hypothetical protein